MSLPASVVRRAVPEHGPWPASVPAVLQRVYAARGVLQGSEAELKLSRMLAPDTLGQIEAAVDLLQDAIASQRHIVIVGDFDCDGATGTAVAVRGLRMLGATRVSYQVPHRMTHGYGLSPALVADMVAREPELVVTVDNGIACHAGIAAAKAHGWRVLVTDHHLPGPRLPMADAIVNPNLDRDPFGSKALAGVGVIFYLLLALRRRLRDASAFAGPEPDLAQLLDLVAVGTIADLVPLDYNNRLLVAAGMRRIREGRCQPGIRALVEVAGREISRITAADIGFSIGPRLNAAGRLDDMSVGIECLLSDDPGRARALASTLDAINAERRGLQQRMVVDAEDALKSVAEQGPSMPAALVLFDERWHPGVIGLVASRIKDQAHRPTFAFAPAEPGSQLLRGSARSIAGFHVRDAIAAIDARHPGLIERFGGHAMAAGLTMDAAGLATFEQQLKAYAEVMLAPWQLSAELPSDGPLLPADFSRELAEALAEAGPWGQGFPEPVFDNEFSVLEWRVLSERHLKFSLQAGDAGPSLSAIHFGGWNGQPPPARIHAAYQLDLDDYRERRGIQLLIRQWQAATPAIVAA